MLKQTILAADAAKIHQAYKALSLQFNTALVTLRRLYFTPVTYALDPPTHITTGPKTCLYHVFSCMYM